MIKLADVKAFIEGHTGVIREKFGGQALGLADWRLEQVAYRAQLCYDSCYVQGKFLPFKGKHKPKTCVNCGCSVPGKWFSTKACPQGKYPDLMDQLAWAAFKEENDVTVDFKYLNLALNGDI